MKKVGAAVVAAVSALLYFGGEPNIPEGVTPTTQIVEVSGSGTTFNVEVSGVDRGMAILIGYAYDESVSVTAVSVDGQALSLSEQGYLQGVGVIETWLGTGIGTGTLPVSVTMSEDFEALVTAVRLTDIDQASPLESSTVSIGEGVAESKIICPSGDATLAVIMSMPFSPTLSTPSGFSLLDSKTGKQARMTVLMDDDSSEDDFDLVFSQACHWGVVTLGLKVAP